MAVASASNVRRVFSSGCVPDLTIRELVRAAQLRTCETDCGGLAFKKWRPLVMLRRVSPPRGILEDQTMCERGARGG